MTSVPATVIVDPDPVATSGISRPTVFAIVAVALVMGSIDITIVATALRTLGQDLHASIAWTAWTITAYQLGGTVVMPVAGRLSDQYGRKRVFMAAIAVFTASSLACGLATSIYMLVAMRAIQALGGGALMPSAAGIVSDHFGSERDRAIGMFSSIWPIGSLAGPVLGGIIINYWSWRAVFFVNVPVGIVLLIVAGAVLPASPPRASSRPDWLGSALLGALILGIMLGVTGFGTRGSRPWSAPVLVPLVLAVAAGVGFVRRNRRSSAPILPPRLVRGRDFLVMNVIVFFLGCCAFGFASLVPLYAQERYHVHVLQSGTLLTARAVGSFLMGAAAALLIRRTGYRKPMAVGYLLVAAGLVLMAMRPPALGVYDWLALASLLSGVGIGIATPAAQNANLARAPEDVAAITGIRGMFRQAGGILGLTVTTVVVTGSANQGLALAHAFLAFAVIVVLMLPLVLLVPERHGAW
jgi:EmrB/QacA subfamily drug resistance transporter